jgi:hypothetical protein
MDDLEEKDKILRYFVMRSWAFSASADLVPEGYHFFSIFISHPRYCFPFSIPYLYFHSSLLPYVFTILSLAFLPFLSLIFFVFSSSLLNFNLFFYPVLIAHPVLFYHSFHSLSYHFSHYFPSFFFTFFALLTPSFIQYSLPIQFCLFLFIISRLYFFLPYI